MDGAITVIRVGVGVGVGVRVRVRVEVSAWSSLGAGVAALPDDEGHEVRQFDVGLRVYRGYRHREEAFPARVCHLSTVCVLRVCMCRGRRGRGACACARHVYV